MTYQSPFTHRYGSEEMRAVWSELAKRRLWRRVWLAVAESQAAAGLVSPEQVDDIRGNVDRVDIQRAFEIEAEIGHDLMAELRAFTEQCPLGGAVLHWGLTSADVQDNVDVVRQRAALGILLTQLSELLLQFSERIEETSDLPILGYTHLQPAEPTTLGYRLSVHAQDLLDHFEELLRLRRKLKGKGIKGAVGTAAPFVEMLEQTPVSPEGLEATVMEALELEAFPVTSQTYPRIQDYTLVAGLAGLAATLHKFSFDLRLMQSPALHVAAEPFGELQVGSTAMPFKQNPVMAEKVGSLARNVAAGVSVAWSNAALNLLERTLDDSANRRTLLPETFLGCDEMLRVSIKIMKGISIDQHGCETQLETYGPFASLERVLNALVKAGADRVQMHEHLRTHSLSSWEAIREGKTNPLTDLLTKDTVILKFLQPAVIKDLLKPGEYLGLAPQRAHQMATRIKERVAPSDKGG